MGYRSPMAAAYHHNRNEPNCKRGKAEWSLYSWIRRKGTRNGWRAGMKVGKQPKPRHQCETPVTVYTLTPSAYAYYQHRVDETPPCMWSKACASYLQAKQKNPDLIDAEFLASYQPRTFVKYSHDCDSLDGIESDTYAYDWHKRRGEDACLRGKAANAFLAWRRYRIKTGNPDYGVDAFLSQYETRVGS